MDVLAETSAWFHHRHDQENTVTTPAAPRNALADIASGVNELVANPLIERLAREGLGKLLAAEDAEHVIGLIRVIEAGRQPLPQRQPDSPQQPA